MKTKITAILVTILFSMSLVASVSMAGNRGSNNTHKNPRKAANYNMLQSELEDPYRSNVEVVNKKFQDNQNFTNKKRDNYYMLLEELEY